MPIQHKVGKALALSALLTAAPNAARAEDFFAGIDFNSIWMSGSSSTTNGGAAFAGGGTVYDVRFGHGFGLGGHLGYRVDPNLSLSLTYAYAQTGVSWNARYPVIPDDSSFRGSAASHMFLGKASYMFALSDTTGLELRGGLGVAVNNLSNVVETLGNGVFGADLETGTRFSPAAQLGIGLSHQITPNAQLAVTGSVTYLGGFKTGENRIGNLGVTQIAPYEIDRVWGVDLGASVRFDF